MSLSLTIKVQIRARHRPHRWPFPNVCIVWQIQRRMISACSADLPICNAEIKRRLQGYTHCQERQKKSWRAFLHRLHLSLSTLTDLEVLSLHDWQQENSLWFRTTVSKRCESGWYVVSELFYAQRGKALWVTMEAQDPHCSFKGKQKNPFLCSLLFTNMQTRLML